MLKEQLWHVEGTTVAGHRRFQDASLEQDISSMVISIHDSMYFENDEITVISILIYAFTTLVVIRFVLQSFPHCMKHDHMCGYHIR